MIPVWDVLRVRRVWEMADRPACSHAAIEVEYDPDFGAPTGDLACRGCGNIWAFELEPSGGTRGQANPNRL
ncbi:MAG: hypothetical protein ACRDJ2_12810 [Actinomycetota bacterium]